jgi:hypothetical protein
MNAQVQIDVRQLVFPMIEGSETPGGFRCSGFLGTGFFVGRRGLAQTAAHVVSSMPEGLELRVALPTAERAMRAREQISIPRGHTRSLRLPFNWRVGRLHSL